MDDLTVDLALFMLAGGITDSVVDDAPFAHEDRWSSPAEVGERMKETQP